MMLFMAINKVSAVENYQTKLTTEKVTTSTKAPKHQITKIPTQLLFTKKLKLRPAIKMKRRNSFYQKSGLRMVVKGWMGVR